MRGDRSRREIALVLTGGAYGEGTGVILDALAARGASAAFFLTGEYLADADQRRYVRRMLGEGHYVGPHSHAHLLYCAWDDRLRSLVTQDAFREDLLRNVVELRALGALPTGERVYFIPPYEWYNDEQAAWARGMEVALINFTPGSGSNRDWIPEGEPGFVSSAEITAGILDFERTAPDGLNGFLLLLHLGSQRQDKMHAQLPALLDELHARGYRFVRVDRMLTGATCEPRRADEP